MVWAKRTELASESRPTVPHGAPLSIRTSRCRTLFGQLASLAKVMKSQTGTAIAKLTFIALLSNVPLDGGCARRAREKIGRCDRDVTRAVFERY